MSLKNPKLKATLYTIFFATLLIGTDLALDREVSYREIGINVTAAVALGVAVYYSCNCKNK